jgi:hypothetical protein
VLPRDNRRSKTLWLVSARLGYCPHCTYVYAGFVFRDRIISSSIWPESSPNLNPCDFFFLVCLKDKVYNSNPQTEEELKENIRREIADIFAGQLKRVNLNLFRQYKERLHVKEKHFQHLI